MVHLKYGLRTEGSGWVAECRVTIQPSIFERGKFRVKTRVRYLTGQLGKQDLHSKCLCSAVSNSSSWRSVTPSERSTMIPRCSTSQARSVSCIISSRLKRISSMDKVNSNYLIRLIVFLYAILTDFILKIISLT